MTADRFWNEEIETLSPAEVRRLESERLRDQVAYDYAMSPFYRSTMDAAGVRLDQVRCVDDLARIPFMEKADIAASQADGTLLGLNQCAPLDQIVRIQATGGTTGAPMRIGLTRRDIADYGETGARALWAMGCRPGEIVFECMNYNLYSGGLSDHLTFETVGAATIPYGVGHSERLLQDDGRPDRPGGHLGDALGTPCAWPRSPRSSASSRGPSASGRATSPVRPGCRSRATASGSRRRGAWSLATSYGTGELGLHSGECEAQAGVHFGGTGIAIAELIDPDTGDVLPFEDGQQGEVVYTSIHREACPLLRMRAHDLMQVFTEPCACGRTSFRFRILGRSDDMFIVKGVNVFPLSIQAVLMTMEPDVTGEFRVVIDRPPPIDYPVPISVEAGRDVPTERHDALARDVVGRFQATLNFTAAVELVPPGSIATETKARRVIRSYRGEVG